jgi:RHS repeat-associated protein
MRNGHVVLGSLLSLVLVGTVSVAPISATVDPGAGPGGSTLGREPLMTPEALGDGSVDGLQYADPAEALATISPPEASSDGGAQLGYPLLLPPGRGITPELALTYDSGGGNGWLGLGWDLSVGEVAVDTSFGAPHFDPGLESETYLLDGEMLVPNSLGETWEPRVAGDRQDYTRQVESDYEQVIRRSVGDGGPDDYYWEVHDKEGNVRWYGGHPDSGGPVGTPVQEAGEDLTIDRDAIVYDEAGNAVRWLLSAQRDVGVNLIRYAYETIHYAEAGTGWTPVETCSSSATAVCARHTYLSKIEYTAAAQASGMPEDPAYEVHFELESDLDPDAEVRLDPVVDGMGGYVDLVTERLARVEVRYGARDGAGARDHDQVAVRYDLDYTHPGGPRPFGKTLLRSVAQSGGTADEAVHEFEYYDEVTDGDGTYDGFAEQAQTWDTGSDLPSRLLLDSEVSVGALGSSQSNSAEGHAYIGFNPAIPQKVGSFGGSIQIGGGRTEAMSEWVDLNGDSLPDKVFLEGSEVKFRLNRSGPSGETSFGGVRTATGISALSSESNLGLQGSVEAHLGVTVAFGLGADVSWGDTYFTDVNSDGLPDLVTGGQVFFNRLVAGVPTFATGSDGTFVPLPDNSVTPDISVEQLDEIQADLAQQSPLVDTVRRWEAPFAGTVSIDAPVTLDPPNGSSVDGVRVAVEHDGDELESANLLSTGATAFGAPISREVDPGDHLYFRVGSVNDGANDEVEWAPVVSYTAIDDVADVADVPLDVNGLSQTEFSAADDFTLAGRPDTLVVMPFEGTVRFEAVVDKTAVTTDELRLVLEHNGVTVAGSDITIPADLVGEQTLSVDFPVAEPVLPDPDDPDAPTSQDTVHARLAVDSPIDLTVVDWAPRVFYTAAVNRQDEPVDVGSPTEPTIVVDLAPEIDQYPQRSTSEVSTPWEATTSDTVDAVVALNLSADNPGGRAVLSVKSVDGLVAQQELTIPASDSSDSFETVVDLDAALTSGEDYWVDLVIRDAGVSERTTFGSVALRPDGAADDDDDVDVPATLHWSGRQGIFPLGYRGWAVAGYTAPGALATTPVDESAFVIDTDELPSDPVAPSGFEDLETEAPEPDPSFAFLPVASPVVLENQPAPFAGPVWRGSRDNIAATADRVRSSRYGADSVEIGASTGGSGRGVTRVGVAAPSAALSFGLGPLGASFGVGPSFGLVDYEDMNGDGYPDVITPATIHYTTQRGTFASAARSFDELMDVTNQDLTFSVSGGLSSGLVDIKSNTKGKTNATQGSAAGKGDDANDSGGGMGIGVEVNASWTSPNASGPADSALVDGIGADPTQTYGDQLSETPGDSSGQGAPIQQELADVNGDGLPDRVYTTPEGVFAHYNLGYAFTRGAVKISSGGFEAMESYAGALSLGFSTPWAEFSGGVALNWNYDLARYTWADVNGDGILDQVHKRSTAGSPYVAFGTGSGVLTPRVYGTMQSASPANGVDTGPQASFDRSNSLGGGFDFTVYVGPLCLVACYLVINPGASYQNSVSSPEVDLQDVDGDGFADSVSTTDDDELKVRLNQHGRTNLLAGVSNPLGGHIGLEYERDGNTVDHPDSVWTMSKVEVDDGRPGDGADVLATAYEYSGLRYDRVHRQSLGYSTVRERELDAASGDPVRDTERTFLNDNVFVSGLETAALVTDAQTGENLRGATMEWGFRDVRVAPDDIHAPVETVSAPLLDGLTGVGSLGRSVAPLMLEVGEQFYDGPDVGQETRTTFVYDGLGNVLVQSDEGETDDPDDDLVASFTYSDCEISSSVGCVDEPANASPLWSDTLCSTWVSLPAVVEVTNGASGADEVVYRHRDGRADLCDNASVTHLEERVDDSTVAVTSLAYNAFGSYDRIVYPEGEDGIRYAVAYTYDEDRYSDVAEVTDYDLDDAAVQDFLDSGSVAGAVRVGLTSSATFEPLSGRVASRTDANGNETTYGYDALGRIVSISSPRPSDPEPLVTYDYHPSAEDYGYAVARHYDAFNPGDTIDTVTFVDGIGRVTQTKRDARLFDGAGQPAVDGRIVSGATNFDALGRAVEQYYPVADSEALETYELDVAATAPTTTEYDLWDMPVVVVEPGDRRTETSYEYAELDGVVVYKTTTTDPRDRATVSWTDVRDRVLALDDEPEGAEALRATYEYNGMGELLTFVDTAGETTTHSYDMLGRRLTSQTPDGGLVELSYDPEGKLVSRVSPNLRAAGEATTYGYELSRLVSVDHPGATPDVRYTYGDMGAAGNGAGRIVRSEDGTRIVSMAYDEAGALVEQTAEMKLHNWDPSKDTSRFRWTTAWAYDGLGRVESMVYPDGQRLAYDYDAGGQPLSVVGEEDGYETVVVGVDEEGDDITEQQPRTWEYDYLLDRQYDEFLTPRFAELGNGVTTQWSYDEDTRRLARMQSLSPNRNVPDPAYQEIQDLNYTYDAVGNPLTYVNDLPAPLPSLFGGATRQSYTYDPYDRLVEASGEWDQSKDRMRRYTVELGYDEFGNVVAKDQRDEVYNGRRGLVQRDTTYSFDRLYEEEAPHQATSVGRDTYHYDANGNLLGLKDSRDRWIRQLTWDATDRLRVVDDASSTTTYRYDDTGQRTIERGPQGETAFVNPWVTVRNGTEMFKHVWVGEERLATQRDDGGEEELKRYFLHKDLQGSTNMVTDYRGDTFQHHEYFPTGEVWIDESSTVFRTPYQFAGSYTDEVRDLLSTGARWYDPQRELMYSADPILVDDPTAVVDQPSLSTAYAYAGSNPVANVDPTGYVFTSAQAPAVIKAHEADRARLKANPKLAGIVADSLQTRLPRSFVRLGLDIERADRLQKFADRFDAKPFVEINLSEGTVKFSLGIGKRLKVGGDSSNATGAQTSDVATTQGSGPSATNGQPPPTGGSSAQAPQSPAQTSMGAGSQADAGSSAQPPPRPPKPLPKSPAQTSGAGDAGVARAGQ